MTQGFLNKLRREMFDGMQDLPIKYFDTHQHGDIMSYYTNDIDTLRQLVSQAIPLRSFRPVRSCCACLRSCCITASWMTLVLLLGVVAMMLRCEEGRRRLRALFPAPAEVRRPRPRAIFRR